MVKSPEIYDQVPRSIITIAEACGEIDRLEKLIKRRRDNTESLLNALEEILALLPVYLSEGNRAKIRVYYGEHGRALAVERLSGREWVRARLLTLCPTWTMAEIENGQ